MEAAVTFKEISEKKVLCFTLDANCTFQNISVAHSLFVLYSGNKDTRAYNFSKLGCQSCLNLDP